MPSKVLQVADDFTLPIGIANKTICIFGKGGSGKSNLEVVLAEELYRVGVPTCIVDPADIHYGIKSARDGKSAGLPFVVFGGLHADVPVYPENGALLADLFLDRGLYMVIVTQPWTGGERSRFMTDFANRLYTRGPEKEARGSARVLILEEAHEYVPLSPAKGEEVMLGAMKRLYTVGRNYWIGFIAATRRPAKMHTDLRNGADATAFFQIVGTQDRKAMNEYLGENAEPDVAREIQIHLAKLPVGTAYFYQPHDYERSLSKVHFRHRNTFDTTTTEITAGHMVIKPVLAPVDLEQLGTAMTQAREKAQQADPNYWKRQVAERDRRIRDLEQQKPVTVAKEKVVEKRVEVPVVTEKQLDRIGVVVDRSEKIAKGLQASLSDLTVALRGVGQTSRHVAIPAAAPLQVNRPVLAPRDAVPRPVPSPIHRGRSNRNAERIESGDFQPGVAHRRVLDSLAFLESVRIPQANRTTLALMAGSVSAKGGYFTNTVSKLRSTGLVDYGPGSTVFLTDPAGRSPRSPRLHQRPRTCTRN